MPSSSSHRLSIARNPELELGIADDDEAGPARYKGPVGAGPRPVKLVVLPSKPSSSSPFSAFNPSSASSSSSSSKFPSDSLSKWAVVATYASCALCFAGLVMILQSFFMRFPDEKMGVLVVGGAMVGVGLVLLFGANVVTDRENRRLEEFVRMKAMEMRRKRNRFRGT